MASRAEREYDGADPPLELLDGLAPTIETTFREPYDESPGASR
jgi:hypothetical protein